MTNFNLLIGFHSECADPNRPIPSRPAAAGLPAYMNVIFLNMGGSSSDSIIKSSFQIPSREPLTKWNRGGRGTVIVKKQPEALCVATLFSTERVTGTNCFDGE
jgi:hypothetical protein